MSLPLPSLCADLARHRRRRRLSQASLARAAGVSLRSLQRLEAGAPGVALETLLRVTQALGLELHLWASGRPTLDELRDLYPLEEDADAGP